MTSLNKKNGPDYREIETKVSLANIKDQVGALLYASGTVNDDEEIISITFDFDGYGDNEIIPTWIKVKRQQEVEVITV